jgi:hypothetical protein
MALIEIPVDRQSPDNQFTITLDKVVYTLRIKQNDRTGRFFLDIMDENGLPLAMGIALVVSYNLLEEYHTIGLPPGDLFIMDTKEQNTEPDENNFGESVVLLYNEAFSE